ncbi:MAG TPA: GTPase HflX [bacterium]|nr:GTPase HflX [bacterium]
MRTTGMPLGHKLRRGLAAGAPSEHHEPVPADGMPRTGPERAILVGMVGPREDEGAEPLQELARLADTAGAQVAGLVVQRLNRPHPATAVGAGKVDEIRSRVRSAGADVVIFDADLTPAQQRNLERALETKVLDRTALVLDIFAQRARSREGRLQVELAQMTYLLPRLAGRGVLLSRLGGGIGTRGPGETKLEVDRRRIRTRITALGREIDALRRHRQRERQSRKDAALPVAVLVGYTNAGKSTLLNALTRAHVLTADKLFATLDPTTRRVALPDRRTLLLVDTVGFIQKLPHELVAAFRATLEEVTEADLLIHVIDASHPYWTAQRAAVEQVLRELGAGSTPRVTVLNKADRLSTEALRDVTAEEPEGIPVSAVRGVGLANLLRRIAVALPGPMERVRLVIPYHRAGVLSRLYDAGRVVRREDGDAGIVVEADVPAAGVGPFRPYLDGGAAARTAH